MSSKKRKLSNPQEKLSWDTNEHVCNLCGLEIPRISDCEFDHTEPFSAEGKTDLQNVKLSHRACNRYKSTKDLEEVRQHLSYYEHIGNTPTVESSPPNKIDRKEHTKILNDDLRKLQRIQAFQEKQKIVLKIPIDERAYKSKTTSDYTAFSFQNMVHKDIIFDAIEYRLRYLEKCIQHLQSEPKNDSYVHWKKIFDLKSQYQEKSKEIKKNIELELEKKLKENLPDYSEFAGDGTKNSFFKKNIEDELYFYQYGITNLEKPIPISLSVGKIPGDDVFRVFGETTLIQSQNEDQLNTEKLKNILDEIIIGLKLKEEFQIIEKIQREINNECLLFEEKLEKLVDDIDAGYILKGQCTICE